MPWLQWRPALLGDTAPQFQIWVIYPLASNLDPEIVTEAPDAPEVGWITIAGYQQVHKAMEHW